VRMLRVGEFFEKGSPLRLKLCNVCPHRLVHLA
jgi:hypothetical protein